LLVGSLLAIGAHPDDVVMGLGGLIARLTSLGHAATILTLSSGELAGNPSVREREDERAAEHLGARVVFGRLPDGAVPQREAMHLIAEAIRRVKPTLVFAHDPGDTHQDHVTAARAATAACRALPNLFFYEGPTTTSFQPACTVDVSATWTRKLEALAMHQSQIPTRPLIEWVRATAHYRAWPAHAGTPCESFRVEHADLNLFAELPARSVPTVAAEYMVRNVS
jgi:LmbE family N-acetylglucosaminyl deacetylase